MKAVTKIMYEAVDGVQFPTEAACQGHERELEFSKLLDESYYRSDAGFRCIASCGEFVHFVDNNRDWVLREVMGIEPEDLI